MSDASAARIQTSAVPAESTDAGTSRGPEAEDRFAQIGAYGFLRKQTPILAALVTEDPLLLIGHSGTGKTFLLNSISEALGLEHRHYNASLISFDDLVGFPYPDGDRESVRFLETPATIWGAESVLIDEISRCKPEHQNRLFSLVHERCIQGIPLDRLRYRWAAMNPCTADQGSPDDYLGSEPLDPALADRFALIVDVSDWAALTREEQRLVTDPAGEGRRADDGGNLSRDLAKWQQKFERQSAACPTQIIDYAQIVVTALGEAKIRVSPRRARLLARSLLAAHIIEGRFHEATFRTLLACSLPHRAWGEQINESKIDAVHQMAWQTCALDADEKWLHQFHLCKPLHQKLQLLLEHCPGPDIGTLAIEQLLANEPKERAAAFAFATYPAALGGQLPIGREAVNDLARVATPLMHVDGEITWEERYAEPDTDHAELTRLSRALSLIEGGRRERAQQLLYWCLLEGVVLEDPQRFESDFAACVKAASEWCPQ